MNSLDSNELKTFRYKFSVEFLNYLKEINFECCNQVGC